MSNPHSPFDPANLYDVIVDSPNQIWQAFEKTNIKIPQRTKKIIFCGMGGSALPANLLKTFLATNPSVFNIPIKINRDYTLPKVVDKNWCGFFDSYSGNTTETLECLREAEYRGLKTIVLLARQGKLQQIAAEKKYPLVIIPDTKQPRLAAGYVLGALLKILVQSKLLKLDADSLKNDIDRCLNISNQLETQAQELAQTLKDKIPLVYASNLWKYLAFIWKINFNENSKVLSFWNAFPEINHNEVAGFTTLASRFQALIIKDPADHPQIQRQMAAFQKVTAGKLNSSIIEMPEGSPFFKLLTTLLLGFWTAYFLALAKQVNPNAAPIIAQIKSQL